MFKNILVPLNGSKHSLRALNVAIQIAKKFERKITLIHVYSVTVKPIVMPERPTLSPPIIPVMLPTEVSRVAEAAREAGSSILMDGEQKVRAEGVPVETVLREGDTVQEIVKTAVEGFDLIVIGTRVTKIRDLLLGSLTGKVIRHSLCPVLVVK